MFTTDNGGVPGANTPTSCDGLTTPHSQPAKPTNQCTRILGAIRAVILRAVSGFTLDRGIDAYTIMMLILLAILMIQGVAQWML